MAVLSFKDCSVTVNSVDLSGKVRSVVLTYEVEAVDATVMGGNRANIAGIQNNQVEITFAQDFAASNVEATVFPLVGTTTTIIVKPTSSAFSTTNPSYTVTGAYLANHTPINAGEVGALGETSLTFQGGTLAKATS